MGAVSTGLGGTLLPWVVMANIVVTVVAVFLLRVFAIGQWSEQQQQLALAVTKLTERLDEANTKVAKLTLQIAVMNEQIKHLERRD